ncbi:MAG: hypothetical protein V3Q69_13955 (plasmid) [Burkholderia sp.]
MRVNVNGSRSIDATTPLGALHRLAGDPDSGSRRRNQPHGGRISLVRNPFVSPEIMPFGAIASSSSIYATTLLLPQNPALAPGRSACRATGRA